MNTFGKTVTTLMLLASLNGAASKLQAQDTTKVKVSDGKELVLKTPLVKPYLNLKGFGRLYDGGKTSGIGLGVETGVSMGKVTTGCSMSLVKEGEKVKLEESSMFVAVPIGKIKLVGYGYTDLFLRQTAPAYGMNVSGYGVKVGAEIAPYRGADGDWVAYAKVPLGSFTPGIGFAGWGDAGWQGGVKKLVLSFNTSHEIGKNASLSTETLYGIKLQKGSEGYLQFRLTLSCAPF